MVKVGSADPLHTDPLTTISPLLPYSGETLPAPDQEESSRETQQFREQSQYQSRDTDKLAAGDLFSSVPVG